MPKVLSVSFFVLCFTPCTSAEVNFEWATVGNPGNTADSTGFGAVDYTYRIARHEVTNDQYAEFLNAVAGTDTHDLYSRRMGDELRGGINQDCATTCTYTVKPNMGNKPVTHVTFWDAVRFINWLHNDQPTGAQDSLTTEEGAYSLGGVSRPPNASVTRNANATVFMPTEDEWYKAAYHKNDGITGNYYDYPTSSDSVPTLALATLMGDVANPGFNVANVDSGADWGGENGNLTTVGSAMSVSPYGTFDQAGNAWEHNETLVRPFARGLRGGSFITFPHLSAASHRNDLSTEFAIADTGFRVASVPEPNSLLYLSLALSAVGLLRERAR